jgi:hypothetical protein
MLKVWYGRIYGGAAKDLKRGSEALVAARSLKHATEMLDKIGNPEGIGSFRKYWSKTGNEQDLKTASEVGVWVNASADYANDYKRVL